MSSKKTKKKIWVASFLRAAASSPVDEAIKTADHAVAMFSKRKDQGFSGLRTSSPNEGEMSDKGQKRRVDYEKMRLRVPKGVNPEHYNNLIDARMRYDTCPWILY